LGGGRGHLAAGGGVAGFEGVTGVATGAGADGGVVPYVAFSALSTHRASSCHARVLALVLVASLIVPTVGGPGAVSRGAGEQGVADERVWARAHRPLLVGAAVSSRGAHCFSTAGVGLAQVSISKWSARFEGMACVVLGTGANGFVVDNFANGVGAAGVYTRVNTLEFEAGLVGGAVLVRCALGVAPATSVSQEELRAGTVYSVVSDVAVGILAACVVGARVRAAVLTTSLVGRTVAVLDTLSAASSEGIANVVVDAGAHGTVVLYPAVSVLAARGRVAVLQGTAGLEWVAGHALAARADGLVVANLTLSASAADAGDVARVDTLLLLASQVSAAV